MQETKTCGKCGEIKPTDEFAIDRSKKDGIRGTCRPCQRALWRQGRAANAEAHRAAVRRYRERHPRNQQRQRFLGKGLTEAEAAAMLAAQDYGCAVCRRSIDLGTDTHVDHDHSCCEGQRSCGDCVRGLLCRYCNVMLGQSQDNPIVLRAAADYLERAMDGPCSTENEG